MRKILLIIPSGKGTIAHVSYNLYKTLKKNKNNDIYVVNLNADADDEYAFEHVYNCRKIKNKLFYYLNRIYILKHIKKQITPDISISTLNACTTYNLLSGGNEKKIAIFHAPLRQNLKKNIYTFLSSYFSYKLLYHRLDKIVCISLQVFNDIKNNLVDFDAKDIFTIYNAHDSNDILEKSKIPIDHNYLHIFNKDVILSIGIIDDNKSHDKLIRAFSIVNRSSNSKYNLVIIGDDSYGYKQKLLKLIDYYKLSDSVFFLGYQTNPYNFIKCSKLIVSSSKSEGLPGVLIESLMLNIPIVSTNSSIGVWEILSVSSKYSDKLSSFFVTSKGVISSNLIHHKTINMFDLNIDDLNLAKSILYILEDINYKKSLNAPFYFLSEISDLKVNSEFEKLFNLL